MDYRSHSCQEPLFACVNIGRVARRSMARMGYSSKKVLADNIRALRDARKWSNRHLSKLSGVSDRMIGKILDADGSKPTTETIDKLANAFGVEAWQLMIPNANIDKLLNKQFSRVVDAYSHATKKGRRILETQADYIIGTTSANEDKGEQTRKNG